MGMSDFNNNSKTIPVTQWTNQYQSWLILAAGSTLFFGYLGMGIPQHFYQPLFAALTLTILYRHQKLLPGSDHWRWPLIICNFLMFCLLYKLLIGGGISHPFDWLKVPGFTAGTLTPDAPWYEKIIPNFKIEMKPIPNVSDWSIDITKIQTLFLLATLVGAVFRFQPFASLTALMLMLISIPTLIAFNWDWVILFLIGSGVCLYLQSPVSHTVSRSRNNTS